jgi:hypothetical protein
LEKGQIVFAQCNNNFYPAEIETVISLSTSQSSQPPTQYYQVKYIKDTKTSYVNIKDYILPSHQMLPIDSITLHDPVLICDSQSGKWSNATFKGFENGDIQKSIVTQKTSKSLEKVPIFWTFITNY